MKSYTLFKTQDFQNHTLFSCEAVPRGYRSLVYRGLIKLLFLYSSEDTVFNIQEHFSFGLVYWSSSAFSGIGERRLSNFSLVNSIIETNIADLCWSSLAWSVEGASWCMTFLSGMQRGNLRLFIAINSSLWSPWNFHSPDRLNKFFTPIRNSLFRTE